MLKSFKLRIIIASFPLFFAFCQSDNEKLIELTGSTMGTSYTIKIFDNLSIVKKQSVLQIGIDSLLENVNIQMSTYIPESEISKFNNSSDTSWINISYDFAYVVNKSLEIGRLSDGAFDIAIGPIVNLWGFGPEDRPKKIPDEKSINERLKFIGLENISVDLNSEQSRIKKKISSLQLDLSAIAKGFGVDKVADYLTKKGLKNFMVEIGGEVKTSGKNNKNLYWQIGISKPSKIGGIEKVLSLNSLSLATSGDYWNYFEEDGKRFSHTIDPRTGKPITHNLASVSVVHKSCLMADGIATAIEVLGIEKGLILADKLNCPVYLIVREKDRFVTKTNTKFKELFK